MNTPSHSPSSGQAARTGSLAVLLATLGAGSLSAAIVTLTPGTINGLDTSTATFSDGGVTLTPLQGTTPATFNANGTRLGIDDFAGTNPNAFFDPDADPNNGNEERLQMQFAATSGLTQLGWDFATGVVTISGFAFDPGATVSGGSASLTNASTSYANGTLTLNLTAAEFIGTDGFLNLAAPTASAGQTLVVGVTRGTFNLAQLPITTMSYENAVTGTAPSITTDLDAASTAILDVSTSLSVTISPTTFPAPTYLWEFNNGSGFTPVATTEALTFTALTSSAGTYRVTVSNSQGSDSSTTVLSLTDDGDGLNNQWELDNFGNIENQTGADDADQDGSTNAQEFAAGTNPNLADSDNDGLNDGAEATAGSNPLVIDSDGDGYGDGVEVNTAQTNPNDANSSPGVDDGRESIGITFASANGQNPGVNLSTSVLVGAPGYSQRNWNITGALGSTVQTNESDIIAPTSGALVNSQGLATTARFTARHNGTFSVPFNPNFPTSGLFSGYLFDLDENEADLASIDLDDIPYSRYDVVIYAMAFGNDGRADISQFDFDNNLTLTSYSFGVPRRTPLTTVPVFARSADQSAASSTNVTATVPNYPTATHVIFRGVTGASSSFDLRAVTDNVGFAAIQIVNAPDSDGDGMGDAYETEVGLSPTDNGTTDPTREGASGDFDGDGVDNLTEHDNGTDPTNPDTDGDGLQDGVENDLGTFTSLTATGTDPRIPDTDGDGLLDGVETNTGIFVDLTDTGSNPVVADADIDFDGYSTAYEIATNTDPTDPDSPGGPNPRGFAVAFNALAGTAGGPGVTFTRLMYAGVPSVAQKNWNRTVDLANNATDASGTVSRIASPTAGSLVDSSGAVIGNGTSGVTLQFSGGAGAFSFLTDSLTPYGRLFNSFIFGNNASGNNNATVTLGNIPYPAYDAYVYMGSDTNGRTGRISSTSAATTYLFRTASRRTITAATGLTNAYVESTSTAAVNPDANYVVFRNQTSPTFDVSSIVNANQNSLGIFGVQIVALEGGPELVLENPTRSGTTFTATFTTNTAGNYLLERNLTLEGEWTAVGSPFTATAGSQPVSDPAAPAGRAFYRVIAQ